MRLYNLSSKYRSLGDKQTTSLECTSRDATAEKGLRDRAVDTSYYISVCMNGGGFENAASSRRKAISASSEDWWLEFKSGNVAVSNGAAVYDDGPGCASIGAEVKPLRMSLHKRKIASILCPRHHRHQLLD